MLCFCSGLASDTRTDSLKVLLKGSLDISEGALLYSKIAKAYQHSERDSALFYAREGLRISQEIGSWLGIAENAAVLGDIYIIEDDLEEARKNYMLSAEYFEKEGKEFDRTQINMILGNICLAQNDYATALNTYQKCLLSAEKYKFQSLIPHLYNNIGIVYLNIEDYDQAEHNFRKAVDLFAEQGDHYSRTLSVSNIAEILNRKGRSEEAVKEYLQVAKFFLEDENWIPLAGIYNTISIIHQSQGSRDKAEHYLVLAQDAISKVNNDFSGPASLQNSEILNNAARLAFNRGELINSLAFAKSSMAIAKLNSYKVTLAASSDLISQLYEQLNMPDSALAYNRMFVTYSKELQDEASIKKITQLQMQHEFDVAMREKELNALKIEAEHERKETKYIVAIFLVVLIALILTILLLNQRAKAIRNRLVKENLELEKAKLSQELNYRNKELATNMMYLLEKNEFITSIAKKLGEMKLDLHKTIQPQVQTMIKELKDNSSSKIWEEFELRFKEVHTDFYDALYAAFPDLSPNEKRICAFLRLNMSTKEISSITHQSVKSINMARYRLRKRLNIDKDENLIQFLAQL